MLIFVSCETPQQPAVEEVENDVLGVNVGGDFRGNNIGDDIKEVFNRERNNIVYNMPDELTCRIPGNIKDSTFYEITYNFNEEGLYVIAMDVYPTDSISTETLFTDFKSVYDLKYGVSEVVEGFTTWMTRSSQGTKVEITMINESKEIGKPYISLSFYEYSLND